jgi:TolB-like protein/class 3 adenylate cyclase/Tfp pilus assembly protein PilF
LTGERVERRLAAILAADVAGFSALMERDEEGTYARIGSLRREVIEPRLSEHQGRLIKTTGDGFLAEFASPIAALRCALAIQSAQLDDSNALRLRIGLNLGDVIIEESGDVYGEGVNVAARLEALAEPGGILISGKIHSEVEGKVEGSFEDRGEQQVKNITRPVHIYAVRPVGTSKASTATMSAPNVTQPLQLPDKPSIAVLPFQNMSGDPEQEYFADGMVEDIITALSRFKSLFVIARNSSFTYKGKAVDIKQVGRELGVRYVLEGSVRKASGKVRITGQLIDAATGSHLWADKIDGSLEDIFDLQDQVTASVVGAIAPKLDQAEIERVKRKPAENLDAYDCYLRGLACRTAVGDRGKNDEALRFFYRAIELDPQMAPAYGWAAICYHRRKNYGWISDKERDLAEARRLLESAVKLGHDDAGTLARAATGFGNLLREFDKAAVLADQAVAINPNLANAWKVRGWISIWHGQNEQALEQLDRSMRLNPIDPENYDTEAAKSVALGRLRRFDEACHWAARALMRQPKSLPALRAACVAHAHAGRLDDAREMLRRMLEIDPATRI